MSPMEVSFEELLLAVWQFHLPELSLSCFLFTCSNSEIFPMFMVAPHPVVFWCGGLNLTIHFGLPYYLPDFSSYPEALSSGGQNSSCAYECVKYLELTCPIIGSTCAISQIHKPP